LEDGAAATAFVRNPANARAYNIDIDRVVLAGHSTGGFVAALTAAHTLGLRGLILISASDDAGEAAAARQNPVTWRRWVKETYADGMETLVGCTPEGLAREVLAHQSAWSFAAVAPALKNIPVLMITADDGLALEGERFAAAIQKNGGTVPTLLHMTTDHPYSDHRIALQSAVIEWLEARDATR
jgi:pimeloyl-ACP methyl ester carboxylesterase